MKKLSLAALVLLAAVQFSFTNSHNNHTRISKTIKLSPPAVTFTSNEFVDVTEFVEIPCAGESVILQGSLHILSHFTVTGNNVVSKMMYQPQGITGVGSISGERYHSTGVTQEIFKSSFSNGQATSTSINNFRIIGEGPGNNFLIHAVTHVTFNANGTVTARVDNFTVDCK